MSETPAGATAQETIRVPRAPDAAHLASRTAALVVVDCEVDCQLATVLVVAELAENMVKYSSNGSDQRAGTIDIRVEDGVVRVRSKNLVAFDTDGRHVVELISRLSHADANELYTRRMRELFGDPELPRTRLGLLRVAFEGGFRLSCTYQANELEIIAERRVSGP